MNICKKEMLWVKKSSDLEDGQYFVYPWPESGCWEGLAERGSPWRTADTLESGQPAAWGILPHPHPPSPPLFCRIRLRIYLLQLFSLHLHVIVSFIYPENYLIYSYQKHTHKIALICSEEKYRVVWQMLLATLNTVIDNLLAAAGISGWFSAEK